MGKTETALDIMHEAGILCCMLLFVVSGALLILRYANDGDALPIFGGFASMGVGAGLLLGTPGRFRAWKERTAYRLAGHDGDDENTAYEDYDEAIVRVHDR